jgi:hypothetical protein
MRWKGASSGAWWQSLLDPLQARIQFLQARYEDAKDACQPDAVRCEGADGCPTPRASYENELRPVYFNVLGLEHIEVAMRAVRHGTLPSTDWRVSRSAVGEKSAIVRDGNIHLLLPKHKLECGITGRRRPKPGPFRGL